METRVALLGIIVEQMESTMRLNQLLHDYGDYIIVEWGFRIRSVVCM